MPSFGDGCDRAVNRPARSVTGCRTGVSRPRLSSQYSSRPLRSYSGPPARTASPRPERLRRCDAVSQATKIPFLDGQFGRAFWR